MSSPTGEQPVAWQAGALSRDERIYVAGQRGLVGSAIKRRLEALGFHDVHGHSSSELDLRDADATLRVFEELLPTVVVLAAARVGGIVANSTFPVEFLEDNLKIQLGVMGAARALQVPRLLFLGSSCIYPRLAPQPIPEEALLTGPLEPTNDAYAIAKIAGIMHVQSVRREDGLPWISAMPTNLYGPGDNFHPEHSHVLPGLLRRCHEAREQGLDTLSVWGSGEPRREFLHVDDLADACVTLLEKYDDPVPINVGVGSDVSIRELVGLIVDAVGYQGEITFDRSRPDGTPRKLLDTSRLQALGWTPQITLEQGIASTYAWFQEHYAQPVA